MNSLDKNGFSLAEMMVVILVISIALAAMMPIMTKRKTTITDSPTNSSHGKVKCTTSSCVGDATTNKTSTTSQNTSYTFKVPEGVTSVWISLAGGGGGGAAGTCLNTTAGPYLGGGGGGGSGSINYIKVNGLSPGSTDNIVIGKGGLGGEACDKSGNNGNASSFKSYSCNGGAGGEGWVPINNYDDFGGNGGTCSSAGVTGGKGGSGILIGGGIGGSGGGTLFGAGGTGQDGNVSGSNAYAYGAGGGGGGGGGTQTGGNGADGVVIIEW